ncbi:MAG TPA: type II toxin-antitoxin system death-on-curing family toxin [Kofleriaceae bacterium]|nr:type II toxin-antitoxin system death-on-curing family toxin [Kofleriaceae bacterium]
MDPQGTGAARPCRAAATPWGEEGILNEGRLDSALDRPRTVVGYVPDTSLEELAASVAVGIAKGHPFIDGNKRTACVVSLMFLRLNGIEIAAAEDELASVFEDVAGGKLSEAELAQWFTENTMPPEW